MHVEITIFDATRALVASHCRSTARSCGWQYRKIQESDSTGKNQIWDFMRFLAPAG